jgi:hypothetical protein
MFQKRSELIEPKDFSVKQFSFIVKNICAKQSFILIFRFPDHHLIYNKAADRILCTCKIRAVFQNNFISIFEISIEPAEPNMRCSK